MPHAFKSISRAATRLSGFMHGFMQGLAHRLLAPAQGRFSDHLNEARYQNLPVIYPAEPFAQLRDALVGRDRQQIAFALGIPPTASVGFSEADPATTPVTFWHATIWYYPFDQRNRKAIAIQFEGNHARKVDFITA